MNHKALSITAIDYAYLLQLSNVYRKFEHTALLHFLYVNFNEIFYNLFKISVLLVCLNINELRLDVLKTNQL